MSAGKAALTQILPNLVGKVFDYGLSKDFEELWSFDGLSEDRNVIVWARTAGDGNLWPIDASACLSPLDWAAAYARHRCPAAAEDGNDNDQDDAPDPVWPEILILDAAPDAHSKVPSLAHFRTLREDQLPWLTVTQHPDLPTVAKWLAAPKELWNPKQHPQALDRFLREIRLNLTEVRKEGDYDRHAISNIVAPMVLLGRSVTESRHAGALEKLLRACGICAAATPVSSPESPQPASGAATEQLLEPAERNVGAVANDTASAAVQDQDRLGNVEEEQGGAEEGSALSVLLVDDQAHHGWTAWLEHCLPNAVVKATASPVALVESLKKQLEDAGSKDLRFRFQLPDFPESTNPVLFLDLRLFSGKHTEELAFYRDELLPLITTHFLDRDDLAWPSFSSQDSAFKDARDAIENGKLEPESSLHHEALTWLPRIVALADMSLPVVIFSSTSLRRLVTPLSKYGNIFVSNGKPSTTNSDSAWSSEDVRAEMRHQVAHLRNFLAHRQALGRFLGGSSQTQKEEAVEPESAAVVDQSEPPLEVIKVDSGSPDDAHVVVYIDETGNSPNLTFGALIVVYDLPDGEQRLDQLLTSSFGQNVRSQGGKDWLRTNCETVLASLKAKVSIPPKFLRLSANRASYFLTDLETSDELHDESVGDNLWRQMFKQTIEASIYVVAREMAGGRRLKSFSLRAPTRVLPAQNYVLRNALWNRWGISVDDMEPEAKVASAIDELAEYFNPQGTIPDEFPDFIHLPRLLGKFKPSWTSNWMARYFNFDSARPIVEEIMRLYRSSTYRPTADVVRGFPVNAHSSPQAKAIPIAHFLADAMLERQNRNLSKSIEILEFYGSELERALETNRLLLTGRLEEAAANQLGYLDCDIKSNVQAIIFGNLRSMIMDNLRGEGLLRISQLWLLRQNTLLAQSEPITGTIMIDIDNNNRFVEAACGTRFFVPPIGGADLNQGDIVKFFIQRNRVPGRRDLVAMIVSKI